MTKEEFKSLFLKLTEYTIPFGEESRLEKHLPSGFKKDSVGNYYYKIGNSETLFTTHLDTYSSKLEKVNHVIDDKDAYLIRTDGTTILGGDNKLGTCILIGMIKNNVPGTYYFFLGEEPILSGGLWGSSNALNSEPESFTGFKRCIAFDRRGYGSIVVRQMGRMCCSPEFARGIASEFDIKGIKWDQESGYGYYTDTAVFMDVIPECTNISAGGFNEHYKTEYVDLNYTYGVYQAALDMNWEELPVVREIDPDRFSEEQEDEKNINKYNKFIQNKNFDEINGIFNLLGMRATRNSLRSGIRYLTYSKWLADIDFDIELRGDNIYLDDEKVTMSDLKDNVLYEFAEDILDEIEYYLDLYEKGVKNSDKKLNLILDIFDKSDLNKFIEELEEIINSYE
jgi:hypothetical protein